MTNDTQEIEPEAPPAPKLSPARAGFALALLAAGLIAMGQLAFDYEFIRIRFLRYDQVRAAGFWLYIASLIWFGVATIQCRWKWRQWSTEYILAIVFHVFFILYAYQYPNVPPFNERASKFQFDPPAGWQKIDANGQFFFYLPADMVDDEVQGIDSYVAQYSNDRLQVSFDLGWYSGPPKKPIGEWVMIDGLRAMLVLDRKAHPSHGYSKAASVHFPSVRKFAVSKTKLSMFAMFNDEKDQEVAKIIFGTIEIHAP